MIQLLKAKSLESNLQMPRKKLRVVALLVEALAIGQESVRSPIHVIKRLALTVGRGATWPRTAAKRKVVGVVTADGGVGSPTVAVMDTSVILFVILIVMTIVTVTVIVTTIDRAVPPIIDQAVPPIIDEMTTHRHETPFHVTALRPAAIILPPFHVRLDTLALDLSLLVDALCRLTVTEPGAPVPTVAVGVLQECCLPLGPTVVVHLVTWDQDDCVGKQIKIFCAFRLRYRYI